MPCRDFSKATKRVIREASHADRSGNASFLGAIRHCCLGVCSSAKDGRTGTKDHVSLCLELTYLRRAPHWEVSMAMPAAIWDPVTPMKVANRRWDGSRSGPDLSMLADADRDIHRVFRGQAGVTVCAGTMGRSALRSIRAYRGPAYIYRYEKFRRH